jgi:hypothetical protein
LHALPLSLSLVSSVVTFIVMCVLVLPEELLGREVAGKCYSGYAEAREGALEAVEAGEGTCVPPLLAVYA